MPAVAFEDVTGRVRRLTELRGLPVVVLPIYTSCGATCPRITGSLKRGLLAMKGDVRSYQVFVFSFDAADTIADLRDFSRVQKLPASWTVAHLKPDAIAKMTEALDYRVSSQNHEWTHPNAVAFLSPDLKLAKWLFGIEFTPEQLQQALGIARGSTDWLYRAGPWFLALSVIGLTFSTVLLAHLLRGQ